MRQQGLPVNMHTLRKEATRVSDKFKNMSTQAKISSVYCFIKKWASQTMFLPMLHRRISASIWMHIALASIVGLNETHNYDMKLWGGR